MAELHAVADTSPIIALVGLGELRLLDALFARIIVPFAVWEELADKSGAPELDALRMQGVSFLPAPLLPIEVATLHGGEAAAIALAQAIPNSVVLLDDLAARRVAGTLGLRVMGTLGILAEAKRQGLVPLLRPLIARMLAAGYRLGPDLVQAVLSAAGET